MIASAGRPSGRTWTLARRSPGERALPEVGPDPRCRPEPHDHMPAIPSCPSGEAAPTDEAPPSDPPSDIPIVNPDPGATADYWTPARRAASKPKDRRRGD